MRAPTENGKYTQRAGEPLRSRHIPRIAATHSHEESAENESQLIADAKRTMEWLGEDASRSMLGTAWVAWTREQGWTRGYRHAVATRLRDELASCCQESAEQARARIVDRAEHLSHLAELNQDYSAAIGALKLEADLLVPKEDKNQVNIQVNQFVVALPPKTTNIEEWEAEAREALPPPP